IPGQACRSHRPPVSNSRAYGQGPRAPRDRPPAEGRRGGGPAQGSRRNPGRGGADRGSAWAKIGEPLRYQTLPPGVRLMKTVVIADDEPSMRMLVHATIESDDYKVIEAGDGDQAWALIQQYKPSLVLLDVQMPGRSGLEILRSIRTHPELAGTRVILLTAIDREADIEAGLMAGADFYLTKPFSPLDLITRVEEALRL